jgi:beta-alanine degradation protein BauB
MSDISEQIAGSILFENDRVRIWEDKAGPGETKPLHVHNKPYVTVILAGEQGETVGEDGRTLRTFEGLEPGQSHPTGPEDLPAVHAMRNTGSSELSVLIIELLR